MRRPPGHRPRRLPRRRPTQRRRRTRPRQCPAAGPRRPRRPLCPPAGRRHRRCSPPAWPARSAGTCERADPAEQKRATMHTPQATRIPSQTHPYYTRRRCFLLPPMPHHGTRLIDRTPIPRPPSTPSMRCLVESARSRHLRIVCLPSSRSYFSGAPAPTGLHSEEKISHLNRSGSNARHLDVEFSACPWWLCFVAALVLFRCLPLPAP